MFGSVIPVVGNIATFCSFLMAIYVGLVDGSYGLGVVPLLSPILLLLSQDSLLLKG